MNYCLLNTTLLISSLLMAQSGVANQQRLVTTQQAAVQQPSASSQSSQSPQSQSEPQGPQTSRPSAQAQGTDSAHQQAESQQMPQQGEQQTQSSDSGEDYNPAIFQNPIPADQLEFLRGFDGAPASQVARDKKFHRLLKSVVPDCMFHYGHDMPLLEAMETVLNGSTQPVQIRDGRYFIIRGRGPYLLGRGMLWVDLQDGIALGAFYFRPTNGEPTPAMNAFSRQVKEQFLGMGELPPAFGQDFGWWSQESQTPVITARYFITGSNKKILLEHDQDYCVAQAGAASPDSNECLQMNAAAGDIDMDAGNYVEQTHHATNATAWMITGEDQRVFIGVRASTCGDLLPCRIRLTRERVRIIIHRPPRTPILHPPSSVRVVKH